MALKYLIDTNIVSEPEQTRPNAQVVMQLEQHRVQIAIAAVTWHELLFGYHRLPQSRRKQRIGHYLFQVIQPVFPILPFDEAAATWFAEQRAQLSLTGRAPAYADGQIAAVAAVNNLILVTRNVSDFADYPKLSIENWFQE
ncbi:MAG: type II toxin-antitoxin system VapC family toxin [Anaerolineae bacterium]|nr:type II toxin-antitoxin system VapC family toxin [Anaerolineae bacterium]MCO5193049.1 type II toxin-antitoxin system VapC family toxin [Anaerolineae bacterium]MCO5206173.1 type II toxin-antitoxin system VapC family toxin [Anaerolineae bacterium]